MLWCGFFLLVRNKLLYRYTFKIGSQESLQSSVVSRKANMNHFMLEQCIK